MTSERYTREGEESDCDGFVKAYFEAIQYCLDKGVKRTSTAPLPWPNEDATDE